VADAVQDHLRHRRLSVIGFARGFVIDGGGQAFERAGAVEGGAAKGEGRGGNQRRISGGDIADGFFGKRGGAGHAGEAGGIFQDGWRFGDDRGNADIADHGDGCGPVERCVRGKAQSDQRRDHCRTDDAQPLRAPVGQPGAGGERGRAAHGHRRSFSADSLPDLPAFPGRPRLARLVVNVTLLKPIRAELVDPKGGVANHCPSCHEEKDNASIRAYGATQHERGGLISGLHGRG
jgi:hypothetical protein